MCGQCGVYNVSAFSGPEFKAFHDLLFLNVFRGEDSTGVIKVSKESDGFKTVSRKTLQSSPEFLRSPSSDMVVEGHGPKPIGLLGHTRHATKGKVTLANAHPFRFDGVIGSHNGTIHKQFKHRSEYETDSEALYRNINDYGIEAAIEEVNAYDSAYAIQYVDLKNNTLNFLRNSERPLHFTFLYNGTTLLWSSESDAIRMTLRHLKYTTNTGWKGNTTDRIFTLKPHTLYSIPLGENPDKGTIIDLEIPEKKTYVSTTTHTGGTNGANLLNKSRETRKEAAEKKAQEALKGSWTKGPTGEYIFQHSESTTSTHTDKSATQGVLLLSDRTNSSPTKQGQGSNSSSMQRPDQSSKNTKGNTDSKEGGSSIETFRDYRLRFGEEELRKLSWLKTPFEEPHPVHDLFDTDHAGLSRIDNKGLGKEVGEKVVFDDLDSDPNEEGTGVPWTDESQSDKETYIKGYQGALMRESEFRFRLGQGCSCCGTTYNLNDPHQFEWINKIKWFDRKNWVCDTCFETSEGDWVKYVICGWPDEKKIG